MTPMSGRHGAGKPAPDDDPSDVPVMRPERTAAVMALASRAFSSGEPGEPPAFPLDEGAITRLVRDALVEDHADEDITSLATIPETRESRAELVSRRAGVVCGVPLALEAFRQGDPLVSIRVDAPDGRSVERGGAVLHLAGTARGLLRAERVALNFLQRLSGIATLTAQYVHAVRGTGAQILDTRKTTPGWRVLEKYAVRCGGGLNHRAHLADAVLIKDNHLSAVDGDVALAVERARGFAAPGTPVEVECETLEQVADAVRAGADIVMLDNMGLHDMREAVRMVNGQAVTEASGGVNLQTVRGIAETGVDWISVGALTHSPPALDLGLDFEE